MSLYKDLKDKQAEVEVIFEAIQREVDSLDDDMREVIGLIDHHRCETVDEFNDFLGEIKEKLDEIHARLY